MQKSETNKKNAYAKFLKEVFANGEWAGKEKPVNGMLVSVPNNRGHVTKKFLQKTTGVGVKLVNSFFAESEKEGYFRFTPSPKNTGYFVEYLKKEVNANQSKAQKERVINQQKELQASIAEVERLTIENNQLKKRLTMQENQIEELKEQLKLLEEQNKKLGEKYNMKAELIINTLNKKIADGWEQKKCSDKRIEFKNLTDLVNAYVDTQAAYESKRNEVDDLKTKTQMQNKYDNITHQEDSIKGVEIKKCNTQNVLQKQLVTPTQTKQTIKVNAELKPIQMAIPLPIEDINLTPVNFEFN